MKISIITVAFNAQSMIKTAIESVLGQTYKDIEYIIIDGGSSDGTLDFIKSYGGRIAKFVSEPDEGMYDAMNKGIGLATGEVVGILNADDVYQDERVIETVMERMKDPSIDACYGDLVYVNRDDLDRVIRYWKSCPYKEGLFERGWMPAHPTFFVKRWAYEKYGTFDLSVPIGTDHEMLFRFMYQHQLKTRYIPQVLVRMRLGGMSNQSFKNIIRQNWENIKTLKRGGITVSPMFFFDKFRERFRQFFLYKSTAKGKL